jgi:hypothetical protein
MYDFLSHYCAYMNKYAFVDYHGHRPIIQLYKIRHECTHTKFRATRFSKVVFLTT